MGSQIFDVAILGSGFAGTILARCLSSAGLRVLLLEKGRHPRFALGESSTPLAGFCLERLAKRYGLEDLHHLAAHGRWCRHLPDLRRGLKRGFTFFQHQHGKPFQNSEANEARLLVAASPENALADCHWLRQDVDHHLVRAAQAEGVRYEDGVEITELAGQPGGLRLQGLRRGSEGHGQAVCFRAHYVVDGTGPDGFSARPGEKARDTLQGEQRDLLFAHFAGVTPLQEVADASFSDAPYEEHKAAVHHLLREGWMYQLPFDHGVISCGIVLRRESQPKTLSAHPEEIWKRVLSSYPSLAAQFANAEAVTPITYRTGLRHRLRFSGGKGILLLPHTYAFSDPLFSTGMAWSLLAVERLAHALTSGLASAGPSLENATRQMESEARQIDTLIEAAYLAMDDFDLFAALAGLYFAVVSFAEVSERLRGEPKPSEWGFLGAGEPEMCSLFQKAHTRLVELRRHPSAEARDRLITDLRESVQPWNIAGLADGDKNNLYPADLDILVERSHLLGLDQATMRAFLPRLRGEE